MTERDRWLRAHPARLVVAGIVGIVIIGVGTFLVARNVQSSDQAIADAKPPPPAVLTAPVERRPLQVSFVFRGSVAPRHEVSVLAVPAAGRDAVISALPRLLGDEVPEGETVVEVSGRPVVLLVGAVPAYRDLRVGDSGPDVAQLEAAIDRLGLDAGRSDGLFDRTLGLAVGAAWRAAGYEPAVEDPTMGPLLRKAEVVFVQAVPARVVALGASLGGTPVDAAAVTLASGELQVQASLDESEAAALMIGSSITILREADGTTTPGTVTERGAPELDADLGRRVVNLLIAPQAPFPADALGESVRLTLERDSTGGAVLVVPVAALSATQDGGEQVVVRTERGAERRVRVRAGLSDSGYVEIAPIEPGTIEEGDEVVIGR